MVLNWRVSEAQDYVQSAAWKAADDEREAVLKFCADLAKSVNQTVANAAGAMIKTMAR